MSHNQQLQGLLTQVRTAAENAKEEKDFAPIFAMVREFQRTVGPIKFDNAAKWWVFTVIGLIGGGFALAYFLSAELQASLGDAGFFILGGFVIALIVTLVVISTSDGAIDDVSNLIFRKDVLLDNRLKPVDVEYGGLDLYHEYKRAFGDFHRGDESQRIKQLINGQWSGRESAFPYDYYVFRYVRVYYVPVTRTVGKTTVTTMERRTETRYRYGLILDFPYAQGLAVSSSGGQFDYPVEFHPASAEFDRDFSVRAETTMVAAKFLKPAVVLAILELGKSFSDLNLEANREGRMNISFSDDDVMDLERRYSVAQPDEFEREIQSHLVLPKLRQLLQFAETLKKHNDSNF